jgi:hypothetical protein
LQAEKLSRKGKNVVGDEVVSEEKKGEADLSIESR